MRKKIGTNHILTMIMAAGVLTACGVRQSEPEEAVEVRSKEDVRLLDYAAADSYDGSLAQGINGFAYGVAERLAADGENYFFSPYSLCTALSILDHAADGETKSQIENLLGISNLMDWAMQMELYGREAQPEEARLTCANSLWLNKQQPLSDKAYEDFIPAVENYYSAQLYEADFKGDPEGVKKQINDWVLDRTGGMIKNLKESVDPDTVVSLINAVYFYGEWTYPFSAESTYPQIFYGTRQENTVDMMHKGEFRLPYYQKDGLCGLSLPYGDGSKVMNILIAVREEGSEEIEEKSGSQAGTDGHKGQEVSAPELFQGLSPEEKNEFMTNLMSADMIEVRRLQMPKFCMDYTVTELISLLEEMGMVNAFDRTLAEFPGIGEVYISDAAHKAKLEVDELGSRAAAVTEYAVAAAAEEPEEMEYVEFIVDRPFLFTIQDKETGIILFMGQVNNLEGTE